MRKHEKSSAIVVHDNVLEERGEKNSAKTEEPNPRRTNGLLLFFFAVFLRKSIDCISSKIDEPKNGGENYPVQVKQKPERTWRAN